MITDLQHEVASLKRRLDDVGPAVSYRQRPGAGVPEPTTPEGTSPNPEAEAAEEFEEFQGAVDTSWMLEEQERRMSVPTSPAPRSILWVDDHPENNAMLAESWRRDGAEVEIARSTAEALWLLGARTYGLVISDMGRREFDVDVPDAGLRLLAKVRDTNPELPFVLYGNIGPFAEDARAAGATQMTDSTFDLVDFATGLGLLDGV